MVDDVAYSKEQVDPAIEALFNPDYYIENNPDVVDAGHDPLLHFQTTGRFEGRNPSPLFDSAFYRAQLADRSSAIDPLAHYASSGAAAGLSPHPLFDAAYYLSQVEGSIEQRTPLQHFLEVGWKQGLSPHPLFDPAYYALTSRLPDGVNPLLHYLGRADYNATPHYLFSDAIYIAEITSLVGRGHKHSFRGGPPLAHYVALGARHRPKTHPLFDPRAYAAAHAKAARNRYWHADPDLTKVDDLLRHYAETGWRMGVTPSPYFDAGFYRDQVGVPAGMDPLRHYLLPGNFSVASPHPGIDLDYYANQAGFIRDDTPSILHLLATPADERTSPHPAFDVERYRHTYPDVASSGWCPILHFLAHGMSEDRSPNEFFSHNYVFSSDPRRDFGHESAVHAYFAGRKDQRQRIIFVSHDASLTGAPGTVLRLIEDISEYSNVECFAIVGGGGPRVGDFQRVAHTTVLHEPFYAASTDRLRSIVARLLETTEGNRPVAAIVNSAESRFIGVELARAGIPVITLVHEAADLYAPGAFEPIVEASERVVFGSNFVLGRARSAVALRQGTAIVRGQGLQQDHVGTMNRDAARRLVLKELKLPQDTFLVLGCGSVDYRKGADFFVSSAVEFLRLKPAGITACFIWVGEGQGPHSIVQAFLTNDIRANHAEHEIRFVGPRGDVEPYFMAADAFLMTSRVDPFPCVAQEAMAARLPIVAFTEGGGTIEMIGDEAGRCVAMGDTKAMAESLLELANDDALCKRLGKRGQEIVRERWKPDDYSSFMLGLAAEVSRLDPQVFGERIRRRRLDGGPRVFFLLDDWRETALCHYVETAVAALCANGFAAEVILSRGRFSPSVQAGEPPATPRVPYRYLQPGNVLFHERWRTTAEEIWKSVQRFVRFQQPCTLVVANDDLCASLGSLLPTSVGVVGLVATGEPGDVADMYQLAPFVDRIVAMSPAAATGLGAMNTTLDGKVAVIPPPADLIIETPRKGDQRDVLYVRADVRDPATAAKLALLRQIVAAERPEQRIVIHSDPFTPSANVTASLAAMGLSEADLLIAPSQVELTALLQRSLAAVVLSADSPSGAIAIRAMAAGAIPAFLDPPADVLDIIADDETGLVHQGNVATFAARVLKLLGDTRRRTKMQRAGAAWLSQNGRAKGEVGDLWAALLNGLLDEVQRSGAQRQVQPGGTSFAALQWPRSLREAALTRTGQLTFP